MRLADYSEPKTDNKYPASSCDSIAGYRQLRFRLDKHLADKNDGWSHGTPTTEQMRAAITLLRGMDLPKCLELLRAVDTECDTTT